jgi:hypothetical protein
MGRAYFKNDTRESCKNCKRILLQVHVLLADRIKERATHFLETRG